MMPCTARWSSITLSLTCPPTAGMAPMAGAKAVNGTWWAGASARVGGATYASPGTAPAVAFLKKVSHDCQNNNGFFKNNY